MLCSAGTAQGAGRQHHPARVDPLLAGPEGQGRNMLRRPTLAWLTMFVWCAVLVQHKVLGDGTTQPDLTPCSQAQGDKKDILRRLMSKAKEDWKATDHPNWSIRDMDSADFLDSHIQPGQVSAITTFSMCIADACLGWMCCVCEA